MQREINEAYRAEADVAKIEEDVRKLNEKANAIANDIKKHADYVKLDEQFKARQKQMHEVDARVCDLCILEASDGASRDADLLGELELTNPVSKLA